MKILTAGEHRLTLANFPRKLPAWQRNQSNTSRYDKVVPGLVFNEKLKLRNEFRGKNQFAAAT